MRYFVTFATDNGLRPIRGCFDFVVDQIIRHAIDNGLDGDGVYTRVNNLSVNEDWSMTSHSGKVIATVLRYV